MVRRRAPEHRDELRAPLGGASPRRRRRRLPRRGRPASRAHVPRAVGRDHAARRGARRARRRARRPRRDLHADVPRGRSRRARVRTRRRSAGARLFRLRGACRASAARGVRGEGRDLRRRVVPPRALDADARDGRRGRRGARRAGDRVGPPCGSVAGARSGATGTTPRARRRVGAPVPAHVHVGHDRAAERGAARARRLPCLDRPRGRVPDGRERGRRRPLRDRHGLDHGAVDGRRRGCARRVDRVRGGCPRLARRPASRGTPTRTCGCTRRSAAGARRS